HSSQTQVSKEGDIFPLSIEIAKLSNLVVTTLGEEEEHDTDDEDGNNVEIPLSNVRSSVLEKVVQYCVHYSKEPMTPITTPLQTLDMAKIVQKWYADFVDVDQVMMFELVTAANFMDIKPLLDLTCLAVSFYIKGKSADEIRRIFNISNESVSQQDAVITEMSEGADEEVV
ncbi:hypothetical protein ACHAXN_008047, partial [Cyclotella atomus]